MKLIIPVERGLAAKIRWTRLYQLLSLHTQHQDQQSLGSDKLLIYFHYCNAWMFGKLTAFNVLLATFILWIASTESNTVLYYHTHCLYPSFILHFLYCNSYTVYYGCLKYLKAVLVWLSQISECYTVYIKAISNTWRLTEHIKHVTSGIVCMLTNCISIKTACTSRVKLALSWSLGGRIKRA